MDSDLFWSLTVVSIGVLHIVALHKRWGWYMNNYQSAPMREQWGEGGFALYSYAIFTACIVFGAMIMFNVPFEKMGF